MGERQDKTFFFVCYAFTSSSFIIINIQGYYPVLRCLVSGVANECEDFLSL